MEALKKGQIDHDTDLKLGYISGHKMQITGLRTETVDGHRVVTGLEITNSWGEDAGVGGRAFLPIEKLLELNASIEETEFSSTH